MAKIRIIASYKKYITLCGAVTSLAMLLLIPVAIFQQSGQIQYFKETHLSSIRGSDEDCIEINPLKEVLDSNFDPSFTICLHRAREDRVISASIIRTGTFEPFIGALLSETLGNYPNSILLDVGANIGIHSLLGASLGHKVYAIEPLLMNIRKLYLSSKKNQMLDKIKLLKNAVDKQRGSTFLHTNRKNSGGSHLTNEQSGKSERVQTVLLSDIVEDIKKDVSEPITIVIKIDIEGIHTHERPSIVFLNEYPQPKSKCILHKNY
jgi:FkbM family methyltransferase